MIKIVAGAIALLSVLGAAQASDEQQMKPTGPDARIYYFGFEIKRITGIPEAQIDAYGCLYKGNSDQLRQLLTAAPPSKVDYQPFDVRAKIILAQDVWYIDSNGVAKLGGKAVAIDKALFVGLLSRDRSLPCPRRP